METIADNINRKNFFEQQKWKYYEIQPYLDENVEKVINTQKRMWSAGFSEMGRCKKNSLERTPGIIKEARDEKTGTAV